MTMTETTDIYIYIQQTKVRDQPRRTNHTKQTNIIKTNIILWETSILWAIDKQATNTMAHTVQTTVKTTDR